MVCRPSQFAYDWTLYTVYALCAMMAVCWCFVFFKVIAKAKSSLLLSIIVMMFICAPCIAWYCWAYKQYNLQSCSGEPTVNITWQTTISITITVIGYNLSHWVFAYKYWFLSLVIGSSDDAMPRCPPVLNVVMIVVIIVCPLITMGLFLFIAET